MNAHDSMIVGWLLLLILIASTLGALLAVLFWHDRPHYHRHPSGRFRPLRWYERIYHNLTR